MLIKLNDIILMKVSDDSLFVTAQNEVEIVMLVEGKQLISLFELIPNTPLKLIYKTFIQKWSDQFEETELKKLTSMFEINEDSISLKVTEDRSEIQLIDKNNKSSRNFIKSAVLDTLIQSLNLDEIVVHALCANGDQNWGDFGTYAQDC